MEQNSMETDENSSDHMDDGNLLEPLSEVSFSEREKSYQPKSAPTNSNNKTLTDKDPDSSLPDARARVLHLQRVQRSTGSSGSETTRPSSTKKRNSKSHSGERDIEKEEETVSLSLDSLIRRGVMNDIKKAANFKNSFKFGKPDDDISLRVNPSANLFYEHSNEPYSDSNSDSDSYESSGERDDPDDSNFGVTSNGNITNGNGLGDHVPVKRKRGRPPLTEEEKSERAAQKEAIRLQNRSLLNSNSQVDDFSMAMGHSIFHASSPKKRGRPPKNRYQTFLNSTVKTEPNEHNDSSRLDDSVSGTEFKVKKKRGRKPKSYYLEMAAAQANESGASIDVGNGNDEQSVNDQQSPASTSALMADVTSDVKKRGRKPKFLENFFIKLEDQEQYQQIQLAQQGGIVHKKRGRKPKNFYLQQMVDRANETAPAILQDDSFKGNSVQKTEDSETIGANTSIDLSIYANKRGRRPKAYYEQLAALQQDNEPTSSPTEPKEPISHPSILSNEPPVKKKRGRKPKSYYWNLQLQQAAENQSASISQSDIKDEPHLLAHARLNNDYEERAQAAVSNFSLAKRLQKQGRPFAHRTLVRRIIPQQKIFRRPGLDLPIVGLKKRGRKPKNYHLMQQTLGESSSSILESVEITPPERKYPPESLQALQERNRVLFDLFEKRGDEIRILKQRMSNLINDKVEQSVDMNSLSWTNIELCKAYSLQRLNIPLFNYLREKFSIPMPSTDDVRQFIRNIQLERGLQSTLLKILECDGQIYQDCEKLTILQVSYIKTTEAFEYDEHLDLIVGPHKYLALIVARGLYKNWSQLVYFNVDTRVTKQQINSAIEALHKIDFPVIALTSNFEEGKTDIFSDLSINYGKGFFQHPVTQEKIHCFYYLDDMLQATNAHFFGGHLTIDDNQQTKQPINKQAVMQAIHKNYRRIPIPRELLAWTDNDMNNVEAIHTFFSQFTINIMRITAPDDRATKNVAEFISIMKSYAELLSRPQSIDTDIDAINLDRYLEFQNKRLDKIHARLFKLDYANPNDNTRKKFREAMMMSIVSLKMLRKSVMTKYKEATFSTESITNEITRTRLSELIAKNNFKKLMAPLQVFRIIKDIFLGEDCSIKTESKVAFFFSGAVTAAEVNGRNESYYVSALINWICETYAKKNSDSNDIKDLKRKLKKVEETFCSVQNPNFRICENAVNKITNDLIESNAFKPSLHEIIRLYIIQRHLLRIKYFNENLITRIVMPVQMTINLEE